MHGFIYFPLSRLIYILENDYYFTRPVVCGKTTFFRRLFDDEKNLYLLSYCHHQIIHSTRFINRSSSFAAIQLVDPNMTMMNNYK